MGILDIFKPKPEKNFYQAIIFKQILGDIEKLKKDIASIQEELETNKINQNKNITYELTELEKKIYKNYKSQKEKNLTKLSKDLNMTEGSIKVYLSKIRKKGYQLK